MTEKEKISCQKWISENLKQIKTPNYDYSSYGLKHLLQNDIGIYMTNDDFKTLMVRCGFPPVNPEETNWHFKISMKSPAIKKHRSGQLRMV